MLKTNIMKYIFFIVVIFMIVLAVYFLYSDTKENVYAIENNELQINMIREINIGITEYDTINPILSNNRDIQYINKLIFEPLIDITYDFKIENKLAKEISRINDFTYILKLKEDVYWHDGEKFTAEDVEFTINSLKKYDINSIYKKNIEEIEKIERIDEYTIKIILKNKVDFFEYMLCIPMIASHSYNETTLDSNTNIPIGTGKFKITQISENKILLEKSNAQKQPKISKINLILKESTLDLYMALSKNEIDFMITNSIQYEDYVGSLGYNISRYCNREFDYLVLNNDNTILSNKEIRKAINYAIDKNKINYDIYNNKYKISGFPLDYGSYLYKTNNKNEYDINKSKSILLANGWKLKNNKWEKNEKNLRLRILVNKKDEKRVNVAENIKIQLEEFGISINLIKSNEAQFNDYIKYKNYDMILTGNIVSNNPGVETYFGDKNLSNFKSEEVKNIMSEIKSIDNQEELLKEKYSRIQEIYEEEMPFVSLYFNNLFVLYNKKLKGNLDGNWYNIFYNIDGWYKI